MSQGQRELGEHERWQFEQEIRDAGTPASKLDMLRVITLLEKILARLPEKT